MHSRYYDICLCLIHEDGETSMKRKWLAIGIILLFIGTSVIPLTAQKATEKPSSQMNILSNNEFVLKSNCENKLNTVDCEMGGLVDEVNVRCRGPYIIEILERNSVFRITYSHTYNGYLTVSEFVNVTKRDGTLLFSDTKTTFFLVIIQLPGSTGRFQSLRTRIFCSVIFM